MTQPVATLPEPATPLLTPDSPLWAWAHASINERAQTMLEHLEGVRLGEDIEAVHDMRVWSRRLVASMRVFASCFPDRKYRRLLREARRVTQALGAVRDLDVLIDHYERLTPDASPEEVPAIRYFIAVHERSRRQARKPMLAALDELTRTGFAHRLHEYLAGQAEDYERQARGGKDPPDGVSCTDAFRAAAPPLLRERYDAFYAFEPYVRQPEAVAQLHEMRIKAKWLRYTMELFAPAYADELKQPLSAVKKMQELLGDLHDSDIRLQILGEMLGKPLDWRGMEAVGLMLPDPVEEGLRVLKEREERVRENCYRAFLKEWKKLEKQDFAQTCLHRIQQPDG
jgi:CHAD domain-containing protein